MTRTHHQQPTLWTGFLNEEVNDLWEPWMRRADQLLDDKRLIELVFEAQGRRWNKSRTRGRLQTPSEVVLRLLLLKHIRDWSCQTLEREVRANLVYRSFARIGGEKVPDARWAGAGASHRWRGGGATASARGGAGGGEESGSGPEDA